MKFLFRNMLCLIVVFSVLFAVKPVSANKPAVNQLVNFLALGTGTMTGTYFPLGKAFASVWSSNSDKLNVVSQPSNGSIENIRLLKRAELGLAIAQSDIVMAAIKGTGSFKDDAYPELKVLMALFPEVVQIVTSADSGITTPAQLRNRKIAVGSKGSGNAITSLELLAACGIAQTEFEPVFISYDEAIQAMERKECEVMIVIAGIPTKVVSELEKRIKIRIVPFSGGETASLTAALPYLSAVSVPAGTYSGQSEKVDTLALMALLVGNNRLSEDLVYKLDRMIFDNLGYLQRVHERAHDISLKTFMNSVPEGSLHAGASRFYREFKQ